MSDKPETPQAQTEAETATPPPPPAEINKLRLNWWLTGGFVFFALLAIALSQMTFSAHVTPQPGVLLDLPERIGGFTGTEQEVSEGELALLPKDTEFAKMLYEDGTGNSISCQIVLSGSDRRSIHRPEICLPGQGWSIRSSEAINVPLASGNDLRVTKLRLVREVEVAPDVRRTLPMVFLYWFVGDNMTTHDHLERVLRTNLDLLLHNRMHRWAYVIVSAPVLQGFVPGGLDEPQTVERLTSFIREVIPYFQKTEIPTTQVESL